MKIQFSAKGLELTGELEKYAYGKLARLSKQVPRKLRPAADCRVEFVQDTRAGIRFCTCGITLKLGDTELTAKETTRHLYAALDVAEVHIEQQLEDRSRQQRRWRGRLKPEQ